MFGSSVLEVGIGLIFVYLMLSLVCTATNEALASLLGWRAANLKDGISNLLDGSSKPEKEWMDKLYRHPLVTGLYKGRQGPSYIPSRTFALALTDLVLPGTATTHTATADQLRHAVAQASCPDHLKQLFGLMIDEAERASTTGKILQSHGVIDLQKLDTVINLMHQHVEIWFNQSMERVSGWYKRKLQAVTIGIAVAVSVALNVDSVAIGQRLSRDSTLRSAIVAQAEEAARQRTHGAVPLPATGAPVEDTRTRLRELSQAVNDLNALGLPLGWPDQSHRTGFSWWLLKVMGLLLTTAAASLGAPFWFDVLNRFMSVRSAGKAPEEAPKSPKQIPMPASPGRPEGPPPAKSDGGDK